MIRKEPEGFFDPDLIPWQPEANIDGLFSKTLARCPETGSYTRLLKFIPGTDTSAAGPQKHDHLEELWIVEGAIHDLTLDQNFVAGMYANRLREMGHGPWRAPDGAITYELRDNDPEGRIKKQQLEFFDPALADWEGRDEGAGLFPVHPDAPSLYNPIHDDDIAAQVPRLLEAASVPATIVNWGGKDQASVEEWCAYLGELTGLEGKTVATDQTIGSVTIDNTKMHELIGETTVSWRDGYRRMVAAQHPELLNA